MRNKKLLAENYDSMDLFDKKYAKKLKAIFDEMNNDGIPYVFYAQPCSEDDGVHATSLGGYGPEKETGFTHDILIDLILSESHISFLYSLIKGAQTLIQFQRGEDFEIHENKMERAAVGGNVMAKMIMALSGVESTYEVIETLLNQVLEDYKGILVKHTVEEVNKRLNESGAGTDESIDSFLDSNN